MIYNDWFAIGLNLFGSKYSWPDGTNTEKGTAAELVSYYGDPSAVYPFGVDPSWHVSENELLFYNSMKMKMSVVIGISQMTMGILLKASNAKFFKQDLDYYFEFIPMILFDISLFGYMVLLIFMKWSINWDDRMYSATCLDTLLTPAGVPCDPTVDTTATLCPLDYGGTGDGCQPPNLITTLINIALAPGSVDDPMFKYQDIVQLGLLFVAFACVPILLLGKPLMIKSRQKKRNRRQDSFSSDTELVNTEHSDNHDNSHGEEHNFSEVVIHQAIETIEFVLGMVSNTASYLRLWALSLAHTELATVFWEKALLVAINTNNPFFVFIGFAVFFSVTFGVLLCMDVLECFLHALRLHWVEFQNKFYKADGYKFQPFSFRKVLENAPKY
jgi:V-type H+-transporting ATPase subunit a